MEVICLEDAAYYSLLDKVMTYVKQNHIVEEDTWISGEEAMQKLRIKSTTTLQHLRDTGAIRYSQPTKKLILYDAKSINEYFESNTRNSF